MLRKPALAAAARQCLVAAVSALIATGVCADEVPDWAYPGCSPADASAASAASDTNRLRTVPGSTRRFSRSSIADWSVTSDWFPDEHPAMPAVLAASTDRQSPACGYCHLPSGGGRPENANIAGLPAAYIVSQVAAFRAHERSAAATGWLPTALMTKLSGALSDADLTAAADYYSRLRARSWVTVVETAMVPEYSAACFFFKPTGAPNQVPLGSAIVELPVDVERFELRDPHAKFVAYVPLGSIRRGRLLARDGGGRTQACAVCHGANLKGGEGLPGPPLAGRFTGYEFRQLYNFKFGSRGRDSSNPMRVVVSELTQRDMIDLAAYATSLPP